VSHLELVTIIVADYDPAIAFFVDILGFELVEDSPSVSTNTGQPKRWVVVRPPNARTGILLARADNATQLAAVFLRVDDFAAQYARMRAAGVTFVGEPREEPYGRVVVFQDLCGNRWDLLST